MTFQEVNHIVEGLDIPRGTEKRFVEWCDPNNTVGISRHNSGTFELFFKGKEYGTDFRNVRSHLEYDDWESLHSGSFTANRLILPFTDAFTVLSGLLIAEMIREGESRWFTILDKVCALIDLSIQKSVISPEDYLGLTGELLVFNECMSLLGDDHLLGLLDSWQGHKKSDHDYELPRLTIEVKTTLRKLSEHHISSINQVELPKEYEPTDDLILVSVGLVTDDSSGSSGLLPVLVESIVDRYKTAGHPEAANLFLQRVKEYGSRSTGYDHHTMKDWPYYQRLYRVSFFRSYDMKDADVKILRRGDLHDITHVSDSSVKYSVDLPVFVNDNNPVAGVEYLANRMASSFA